MQGHLTKIYKLIYEYLYIYKIHNHDSFSLRFRARSHEDGEEAFTCVNVERARSSGSSNKSNLKTDLLVMMRQYIVLLAVPREMMV